eukprot:scaffold20310_cov125-Isochrysis_galbana.AAC.15
MYSRKLAAQFFRACNGRLRPTTTTSTIASEGRRKTLVGVEVRWMYDVQGTGPAMRACRKRSKEGARGAHRTPK